MRDKSVKNNTYKNLGHLFRCQLPEFGYAAAFRLTLAADKTERVSFDLRHDLEPFKDIFWTDLKSVLNPSLTGVFP